MPRSFFQAITTVAVGTAASCALMGTIAPQSSQAAVFSYDSTFSLTANSSFLFPTIATGSAQFTKADSLNTPGLFDYQVTNFQAALVPLNLGFNLDSLRQPQTALLLNTLNTAVFAQVPTVFQKYSQILPSVLAGTTPNYVGDGDFPPLGTFSYSFSSQDVVAGASLAASQLPTLGLPAAETAQIAVLLSALPSLFPTGGTANISFSQVQPAALSLPSSEVIPAPVLEAGEPSLEGTSTAAPEPTTIAGMALAGGAMAAARRRQKQKSVA